MVLLTVNYIGGYDVNYEINFYYYEKYFYYYEKQKMFTLVMI